MSILDTIGAGVSTGATPPIGTWTNYIIQRVTDGGREIEKEDIDDDYGALVTRLIFKRHPKFTVEAVCKSAAAPTTDFPMGDMCTLAGATEYFVNDLRINKAKGAHTISVDLEDIGIT